MKKVLFFLVFFSFLFSFTPIDDKKIIDMAKIANIELFGKFKPQNFSTKNSKINISKVTNKITKNNKQAHKKNNKKININTTNKKISIKKITQISIKRTKKNKQKLTIIKLPYLVLNNVIKQMIGSPNDYSNSLCVAKLLNKQIVEPCSDVKSFVEERNKLIDEFARNLLKFKKDLLRNKAFYRGYFNCGLLYRYYSYEHYNDCEKLMNMLSEKEKKQLYKYVNFILQN